MAIITNRPRSPYNAFVTRIPSVTTTPQTEFIKGQEERQVRNSAGGVVYAIDPWKQLERFLILGTEGGTYYATENKLTIENAKVVKELIAADGVRVVQAVVQCSTDNRSPKADPGLFVLAMAISFGDTATKRAVHAALPKVARIPTHLMSFVEFAQQFRGWGRALRDAVANWYTQAEKSNQQLGYHVAKYQSRNGFSNRDLLRLSHAKTSDPTRNTIFNWIVKGWDDVGNLVHPDEALKQIWAFEKAKRSTSVKEIVALIREYDLPRETIPTQWLKEKAVWEALLVNMPYTAMVRNLATMSRVGLLTPMSEASKIVFARLRNAELVKKSRIHPIQLLSALRVYSAGGKGGYGSRSTGGTFEVLPTIMAGIEAAFYGSFGNVEASGKRTLLALDVSGSMDSGEIAGVPGLTPREASAAMAMATARSEWTNGDVSYPMYHSVAFTDKLIPFALSPTDGLDDVTKRSSKLPFGRTDCAQPMIYALDKGVSVDTFVIYTDNECWSGKIHPSEALKKYRKETGINARLVVVGMTSTGSSIADPADAGMLDLVGFDSAAPAILSRFSRGEL